MINKNISLNLEEMANDLIDLAIENEWYDIEKDDIEWYLGDVLEDIYVSVSHFIEKQTTINEDTGIIERK